MVAFTDIVVPEIINSTVETVETVEKICGKIEARISG
jgi:hypothetical protein